MQIEYRPRQAGKTFAAVYRSAQDGSYIVCINQIEADRVFKYAKSMGLTIPFPITFDDFIAGRPLGNVIPGLIIDNADQLLQRMSPWKIKMLTVTHEDE